MKLLLVGLCLAAPFCMAQMATTYDGGDLFFSSTWQLHDAADPVSRTAIYHLSGGSWTAFVQSTDPFVIVTRPILSGDGGIVGWDRYYPCVGSCMIAWPRSTTQFTGLTQPIRIPNYQLFLSRNGRFIMTPGFLGLTDYALQNLDTGETWTPPIAPTISVSWNGLADDGTIIGLSASRATGITTPLQPNRAVVWRPGAEPRELMQAASITGLWIAASGKRAVAAIDGAPGEIRVFDTETTGPGRSIAEQPPGGPGGYSSSPVCSLSDDGGRIAFFWRADPTRLLLWDEAAGQTRTLLEDPGKFTDIVLSGNGRVLWAMTQTGRLFRLDVEAGTAAPVFDALPSVLSQASSGSVPGSAIILQGTGRLGGLQFSLGGLKFPVIDDTQEGSVAIQAPWEAAQEQSVLGQLLVRREGHPFEMRANVFLQQGVIPAPAIREITGGKAFLKAALPDFSGLVTQDAPAQPGSTIHAWFFGLGPLDRPVPTGAPGPSDPPSHPLAGVACYLENPGGTPAARGLALPFVAYAPGLIGVYQIDATIPEDWPAGVHLFSCEAAGRKNGAWLPIGQ